MAEVNRDYLGVWYNENGGKALDITTGTSRYEEFSGNSNFYSEGKARIKGDEEKLKIGIK